MMLKIMLDGAADLAKEWENEFNIHLLPLRVSFGNETFIADLDTAEDMMERTCSRLNVRDAFINDLSIPARQTWVLARLGSLPTRWKRSNPNGWPNPRL